MNTSRCRPRSNGCAIFQRQIYSGNMNFIDEEEMVSVTTVHELGAKANLSRLVDCSDRRTTKRSLASEWYYNQRQRTLHHLGFEEKCVDERRFILTK